MLSGLINGTYLIPSIKMTDKIILVSGWEHNTIFIPIFVSETVTWCMFFYLLLAVFQAQASENFKNHFLQNCKLLRYG